MRNPVSGIIRLLFILSSVLTPIGGVRAEIPAAPTNTPVYFYNPETNINNFASLKVAFDTYFAESGTAYFQPFSDSATFESTLAEGKKGVFLLSSWHFRLLQKKFSLSPVLVGTVHGQTMQRKVLSAKSHIPDTASLKGMRIASAGSEIYTRTMLKEILGEHGDHNLSQVKLILVPKDLDALMAVGFGMADAALTAEASLDSLAKINPKQHGLLTRLGISEKQFLTLAVIPKTTANNAQPLIDLLKTINEKQDGSNALRMLGLDGLRELTLSERRELEP